MPVETRLSNDLLSVTWNIKLSLTLVVKVHTVIFVDFQLSGGVLASEGATHVLDQSDILMCPIPPEQQQIEKSRISV